MVLLTSLMVYKEQPDGSADRERADRRRTAGVDRRRSSALVECRCRQVHLRQN